MPQGIKTDNGNLYIYDKLDLAGASGMTYPVDLSKSYPDQTVLWGVESEDVYIASRMFGTSGQVAYDGYQTYAGIITSVTASDYIHVFYWMDNTLSEDNPHYVNMAFILDSDSTGSSAATRIINNGTPIEWLYRSSLQDAKNAGMIEDLNDEWEQTPQADGDTTEDNFGGAFADLGAFDYTQEIDFPDIDDLLEDSPYNADGSPGLFTPYELSQGELATLGKCLYSDDMFNALIQRLDGSSNPTAGILRCIQLPVITNLAHGSYHIGVYGKEIYYQNLTSALAATGAHLELGQKYRYFVKNFGSLTLKEVWGTARDYTDCVITLYLPYVGMRRIDTNQAIGHTLELRMYCDAWTGDFTYMLKSSNGDIGGKYFSESGIIGRWAGNFAKEIPIGRLDNSRLLSNMIGFVSAAAAAPFTGGMSLLQGGENLLQQGLQTSGNTSGNLTGITGYMDVQQAYVMIERAVPDYPQGWRSHIGAVKHQTYQVAALHGYTEFEDFHIDANGFGCSDEEAREIERLMKSGVFLAE